MKMKRFALLLLPLLAVVMINGCASVDAGEKDAVFTAASFNVRVPRDKAPNDWKNRRVRLLSLLKEQRFDIFGVQEAVSMQIKDIKAAGYAMIGCGRVISLFNQLFSEQICHLAGLEPDATAKKPKTAK
jgi:hypothetical protein